MQKQEFESKAGNNISEDDYKLIELVYTWNPSISEIDGKAQILTLYRTCGMPLIRDMAETAVYMKNLSKERDRLLLCLDAINQRIDSVEKGNLTEERCRKDAKDLFIKAQNAKENELVKAFLSQKYGEQMTNKIAKEIIG